MAFKDGAATLPLRNVQFTASMVVNTVDAVPVTPQHRATVGLPVLRVQVDKTGGGNSDVEIVLSTSSGFGTTAWSTTLTNVANGVHEVIATGLVDQTVYFWRTRAAPTGTSSWGDWSSTTTVFPAVAEPFSFLLQSGAADAHETLTLNLGVAEVPDPVGHEQVHLNVGFAEVPDPVGHEQVHLNVGFAASMDAAGHVYLYLGDVNTDTPTPHIWFLRPSAGRPGDGIDIVCHGVGALAATYDGTVEYFDLTLGWIEVPVIDWQVYPASTDAYLPEREVNPPLAVIDPEHTVVAITVPAEALPPGHSIRIRTDGP